MKVVQFIHPLFLVALGLHVSILFVPVGDDSDSALIEEDVPLATLTDSPTDDSQTVASDRLPVPGPNVLKPTAAVPSSTAKSTVSAKAPPTAVAIRPAPAPAVAVRSAGATTPTIDQPPVVPNTPVTVPQQRSNLPDLTAGDGDENTGESSVAANSESELTSNDDASTAAADSPELSQLIASAQTEVPVSLAASLEDLAKGLVYEPEGTGDAIAQQKLDVWQAKLSAQASAGRIETIEPILNFDVVLEYPVESAEVLEGRSLSVCLDEIPYSAEIGLAFDGQGELMGEPELIRSTGYDILNEEAIALVLLPENLPENPASKVYLYDVTVDYNDERCVSLEELKD